MASHFEASAAKYLRLVLRHLPVGTAVIDSERLHWLLHALESFIPELLGQVFDWWNLESLDGVYTSKTRKTGERELEFSGFCILIDTQDLVPLHVRLRHAESVDEIEWLDCRVGERGAGRGGMKTVPWTAWRKSNQELQAELDAQLDEISWVYRVVKSGHGVFARVD